MTHGAVDIKGLQQAPAAATVSATIHRVVEIKNEFPGFPAKFAELQP